MKLFPEILIHMLNQFILASLTDNMKTETYMYNTVKYMSDENE